MADLSRSLPTAAGNGTPIRLLVVGDERALERQPLREQLGSGELDLVGVTDEYDHALSLCNLVRPSVVLVVDGSDSQIGSRTSSRPSKPPVPTIVLSGNSARPFPREARDDRGVFLVDGAGSGEWLLEKMRELKSDAACVPAGPGLRAYPKRSLTEREQAVMRLLARGRTWGQIATELRLNELTVRFHADNATHKLGAGDHHQAVRLWGQAGSPTP